MPNIRLMMALGVGLWFLLVRISKTQVCDAHLLPRNLIALVVLKRESLGYPAMCIRQNEGNTSARRHFMEVITRATNSDAFKERNKNARDNQPLVIFQKIIKRVTE